MLRVTFHSVLFLVQEHSAGILYRNMGAVLLQNRKASNTFTCLRFSKNAVGDTGAVSLAKLLTAPLGVAVYARSAPCKPLFVNNNFHAQFYKLFSLCRPILLGCQLAAIFVFLDIARVRDKARDQVRVGGCDVALVLWCVLCVCVLSFSPEHVHVA